MLGAVGIALGQKVYRRPRGPMDKESAYGAGHCRFESYRGHLISAKTCVLSLTVGRRRHAWICAVSSPGVEPGLS